MKTLEQIKNYYAKENHYDDWESLLNKQESIRNIEWHFNNIIELAQKECLKLASEHAYLNGSEYSRCGCEINKQSITNENNIIK